jgi:hypothetical protein
MNIYLVILTHNEWLGSLERTIQAKNLAHAKATVVQHLLLGGRLKEYTITIIPAV